MSTVPLTPSTERTRCGWPSRTGMQSVTRTVPVAVSNSVSSTRVSGRYQRRVARMRRRAAGGRDPPEAVLLVTQEPGEARGRVEMRQAQPVDGAVDAHQGCRVEVSDDGVILDALAHGLILARFSPRCTARC